MKNLENLTQSEKRWLTISKRKYLRLDDAQIEKAKKYILDEYKSSSENLSEMFKLYQENLKDYKNFLANPTDKTKGYNKQYLKKLREQQRNIKQSVKALKKMKRDYFCFFVDLY